MICDVATLALQDEDVLECCPECKKVPVRVDFCNVDRRPSKEIVPAVCAGRTEQGARAARRNAIPR